MLAAGALFVAITSAWAGLADPAEGIGFLYVIPVGLLAVQFGARVGLLAAGIAVAHIGVADLASDEVTIGLVGYVTRAAGMATAGALVGHLATRRQRLEEETTRWFEMANALLAVASLDGHFTRLNEHWEHVLGFSREELMAQPYAEFVHPDDRVTTASAARGLADGPSDVVDFENRYRTKAGEWRWLLWSARSDGEQVYAVAKDVTDRKQLEAERDTLLARLEVIARTDDLTGLPNRRSWDEELRREAARARRHGHPLCVAILDIDHFKDYNDTYGHLAGDALLRDLAHAWRTRIRVTDFVARYGGEEFAALLPQVSPDEAVNDIVDRLRADVPHGQTCSAGVACWDGEESAESLFSRADAALYQAKRAGRNRIAIAE